MDIAFYFFKIPEVIENPNNIGDLSTAKVTPVVASKLDDFLSI